MPTEDGTNYIVNVEYAGQAKMEQIIKDLSRLNTVAPESLRAIQTALSTFGTGGATAAETLAKIGTVLDVITSSASRAGRTLKDFSTTNITAQMENAVLAGNKLTEAMTRLDQREELSQGIQRDARAAFVNTTAAILSQSEALAKLDAAKARVLNSRGYALPEGFSPSGNFNSPIGPLAAPKGYGEVPPTLIEQFKSGFSGNSGFAGQIGQAAKFGLLYGSMYRILSETEKLFRESFDQAVIFQRATAQLAFQTGQSADSSEKLATQLGQSATQYGLAASKGIEAGQKAIGVFNLTGAPASTQDSVARNAADVASKIAYTSGQNVDKIIGSVAALSQSLGVGPEIIQHVADLDTRLSQQYGLAHGTVLEGLPVAATTSREAGLTLDQQATIQAALAARLNVSPEAAGGTLDQVLARLSRGQFDKEFASVGVTGRGIDALTQAMKIFPTLSLQKQEEIASVGGRGGPAANAAAALFEVGPAALDAAKSLNSSGALNKLVDSLNQTLGGELRRFSGDVKQLSLDIAKSGLFDIIGAVVKGLDELVRATDGLLQLFNALPAPIKEFVGALALYGVANKIGAVDKVGSFLAGGAAKDAFGRSIPGESAGLSNFAKAGIGIGAVALITGITVKAYEDHNNAVQKATDALNVAAGANLANTEAYNSAIKDIQDAAVLVKKAGDNAGQGATNFLASIGGGFVAAGEGAGSFFNSIFGPDRPANQTGGRVNLPGSTVSALDNSTALTSIANAAQTLAVAANKPTSKDGSDLIKIFGDFSPSNLKSGFDQLTASGYTAGGALKILNDAIDQTGKLSAAAAASTFSVNGLLSKLFPTLLGRGDAALTAGGQGNQVPLFHQALADSIPLIQHTVTQFYKDNNIAPGGALSGTQQTTLNSSVVSTIAKQAYPGDKAKQDEFAKNLIQASNDSIGISLADLQKKILGGATSSEALTNINEIVSVLGAQKYVPGDIASQITAQKAALKQINTQATTAQGATDSASLAEHYNQAAIVNATLGANEVKQLEAALIAKAKANTSLSGSIAQGRTNAQKLLTLAAQTGDATDITRLIEQGGQAEVAIAKGIIANVHNAEVAKIKSDAALAGLPLTDPQIAAQLAASDLKFSTGNAAVLTAQAALPSAAALSAARAAAVAPANDPVAQARAALGTAEAARRDAGAISTSSLAYYQALGAVKQAQYQVAQAVLQSQEQINTNAALKVGGATASANAALKNAQLALSLAGSDAVARNLALAAYYQAQQQVADALLGAQATSRLLGSDLTNPATQAHLAVITAQAKLASDRARHQAPDVINADRLNLEQAQNSEKSTAFSQLLATTQTAEQLGTISHSAYLRFLLSQQQNLAAQLKGMSSSANGFKQLTDESNQIKGLILAAADSLNGQFNLGNISLPTVYQARRYAQTVFGAPGAGGGGNNTTITINGADTGLVQQIISQYVGTGNVYNSSGI